MSGGDISKAVAENWRSTEEEKCIWTRETMAWCAALFEGEGCIVWSRGTLKVKFKMCDLDVLEKFRDYSGMGILSGPYKPSGLGKKVTYELVVNGQKAEALAVAMYQWLGTRRKAQIVEKITAYHGRPLTQLNFIDFRHIRAKRASGSLLRELAEEYGVSKSRISQIARSVEGA